MSKKSNLDIELIKRIQTLSTKEEKIYANLEPSEKNVVTDFAKECIQVMSEIVSDVKEAGVEELEQKLKRIKQLKTYISKANLGKKEKQTLLSNADKITNGLKKGLSAKNGLLKKTSSALGSLAERLADEGTMQRMFGDDEAGKVLTFIGQTAVGVGKYTSSKVKNTLNKAKNTKAALKRDAKSLLNKAKKIIPPKGDAPKSSPVSNPLARGPKSKSGLSVSKSIQKMNGILSEIGKDVNQILSLMKKSEKARSRFQIMKSSIMRGGEYFLEGAKSVGSKIGKGARAAGSMALKGIRGATSLITSGARSLLTMIGPLLSTFIGTLAPLLLSVTAFLGPILLVALGAGALFLITKSDWFKKLMEKLMEPVADAVVNSGVGKDAAKTVNVPGLGNTLEGIDAADRSWAENQGWKATSLFVDNSLIEGSNKIYRFRDKKEELEEEMASIKKGGGIFTSENTPDEQKAIEDNMFTEDGKLTEYHRLSFLAEQNEIAALMSAREMQRKVQLESKARTSSERTEKEFRQEMIFTANKDREQISRMKGGLMREEQALRSSGNIEKADFLVKQIQNIGAEEQKLFELIEKFRNPAENLNDAVTDLNQILSSMAERLSVDRGDTNLQQFTGLYRKFDGGFADAKVGPIPGEKTKAPGISVPSTFAPDRDTTQVQNETIEERFRQTANIEAQSTNNQVPQGSTYGEQTSSNMEYSGELIANDGDVQSGNIRVKMSDGTTSLANIYDKSSMRGQAFGGGGTHPGTLALAGAIQRNLGGRLNRFTAFNDEYHQRSDKTRRSKHRMGLALDFTLNSPGDAQQASSLVQKLLKQAGATGKVNNEYANITPGWTGNHIHVNFASNEDANKFLQFFQGTNSQSPPQPISTATSVPNSGGMELMTRANQGVTAEVNSVSIYNIIEQKQSKVIKTGTGGGHTQVSSGPS